MARWKSYVLAVVVIFAHIRINAQTTTTSLYLGFILDSAPISLDASIVDVTPITTSRRQLFPPVVLTISVDCPKAASPDNDACRAQSIYPAELWHTQGSMYGGTATRHADDSTTAWTCDLGGGTNSGPFCIKSITVAGGASRVETTMLNSCYIEAHSVLLLVTAGVEKLNAAWYLTEGVSQLRSAWASDLASKGCPAAPTTATSSVITTKSSDSGVISTTSTSGGGATPIVKATTAPGQTSQTSTPSPSSSLTATGGSLSSFGETRWLGAVGLVMVSLVIL